MTTAPDTSAPRLTLFYVVEVNRDRSNRIACPGLLQEAVEAAQPDLGDVLRYGIVEAPDAGAARLLNPKRWEDVPYWRVQAAAGR